MYDLLSKCTRYEKNRHRCLIKNLLIYGNGNAKSNLFLVAPLTRAYSYSQHLKIPKFEAQKGLPPHITHETIPVILKNTLS